ncbi:MAG: hypothetical protein KDK51_01190 [Deltaproteobacteria bacterium]|nr:hypothetical protein [Deltaproteobacteria bacterium]
MLCIGYVLTAFASEHHQHSYFIAVEAASGVERQPVIYPVYSSNGEYILGANHENWLFSIDRSAPMYPIQASKEHLFDKKRIKALRKALPSGSDLNDPEQVLEEMTNATKDSLHFSGFAFDHRSRSLYVLLSSTISERLCQKFFYEGKNPPLPSVKNYCRHTGSLWLARFVWSEQGFEFDEVAWIASKNLSWISPPSTLTLLPSQTKAAQLVFSVENIYGQRPGQYWYQFDTHAKELYELGMNQDYGALPVQALAFINANSFVSWVGPFTEHLLSIGAGAGIHAIEEPDKEGVLVDASACSRADPYYQNRREKLATDCDITALTYHHGWKKDKSYIPLVALTSSGHIYNLIVDKDKNVLRMAYYRTKLALGDDGEEIKVIDFTSALF